jgi:hypothetical protein
VFLRVLAIGSCAAAPAAASTPVVRSMNPVADAFVTTGPSDGPLGDWNYGRASGT